jgi:hypothetical protein
MYYFRFTELQCCRVAVLQSYRVISLSLLIKQVHMFNENGIKIIL